MSIRIDGTNTTANPGITGGDADTGLQFGADEVSIVTGGTEQAKVDSSGRLLVGTTSSTEYPASATARATTIQVKGSLSGSNHDGSLALDCTNNGGFFVLANSQDTTATGRNFGLIAFNGYDGSKNLAAASITAAADGTTGADDMPGRLIFSTTADGASSPTERMRIAASGYIQAVGIYNITTASAANVFVNSNGVLYRSTSSIKYKTDIETLQDQYADAILNIRPVWYRSLNEQDNPDYSYWGFIAEEVAEIDPRLVHWKTTAVTYDENGSAVETPCDPEPEGVAYDRFVPHLLNLIKRQQQAIETQGAAIAALEAKVAALEANP